MGINKFDLVKYKCLTDNLFFCRYFFKQQNKKSFIVNEHHEKIARMLDLVHAGYITRGIINIAPRYSKTELVVKTFIPKGFALNPSSEFMHLSYSDDLALDNSEYIRDLIQSGEYQTLFPWVNLKTGTKAKDMWSTNAQGTMMAAAAGGQVTGFGAGQVDEIGYEPTKQTPELKQAIYDYVHYGTSSKLLDLSLERFLQFNGAIIIDDPIKPEDADQETIRIRVNSRFDSTIRNRVNSERTPILIIMQRLHPYDLCGHLMREDDEDADKWFTLCMPCIKEDGTALWSFKHPIERLQRMKKANEVVFERQYMQNPKPKTGLMFPIESLNFFEMTEEMAEKLEDADYVYIPVDPANQGGDSFASIAAKLVGDRIYVSDVIYNTDGTDLNEIRTRNFVLQNKAYDVGVEGILGWIETAERIRGYLENKKYQGEFRVLRPRTNKRVRIKNRSSFIKNNFWFRSDYANIPEYFKFMQILTSYLNVKPAGMTEHDDAPDVCEMAANFYEKTFPELWILQ